MAFKMSIETFWTDAPSTSERVVDNILVQEIEASLGLVLPKAFLSVMRVQNGGYPTRITYAPPGWTPPHVCADYIPDGIPPLEDWETLYDNDWFAESDVHDLHLLVPFSQHAELFWCLDYRKSGPQGEPCVTFFDVSESPTGDYQLADTVETFLDHLN
jgi:hypothetical protein